MQEKLAKQVYDVVVVGAGVVGCAMARRFTLEGAHVAILEQGPDILDGASKANSAILHTGFDAPPGSVEHGCIRDGYREYIDIHSTMGLPLDRCSAHVVAWTTDEVAKLESILAKAHENGIINAGMISAKELLKAEPNLSGVAKAAIAIPDECLIDPWSAPYNYLRQALENGADMYTGCKLVGGRFDNGVWGLKTTRGDLSAKTVINCAGLYGDLLDQALTGTSKFKITPRKGQFVVYDKAAATLARSIILPVPTERTKGVVVCRTIFGNLLVGPTAEDQEGREDASTNTAALQDLKAAGERILPGLKAMPVTATYAGLRPASEFKDYQISTKPAQNWITVGAIRSTGLSAALGIAQYVFRLYMEQGHAHAPPTDPSVPAANRLSQNDRRDWQDAGHGGMVCHCEMVTEREVAAALQGPLAAKSLAGLKRQTRVTMGRCQGFFCSARLSEITAGKFDAPFSKGISDD